MLEIIILATTSISLLIHLGLAVNLVIVPKGYSEIESLADNYSSKGLHWLKLLSGITAIINLIVLFFDDWSYSMIISITSWVLFLTCCTRINEINNIQKRSSHYWAFLGQLILLCPTILNFNFRISFIQLGFQLVLAASYLFWSTRLDTDPKSPENGCSLYSRLTFSFINPVLKKGNISPLKHTDLDELIDVDDAENVTSNFKQNRNNNLSIGKQVLMASAKFLCFQVLGSLFLVAVTFLQPFFLFMIVTKLESGNSDKIEILLCLAGLFCILIVHPILEGQIFFLGQRNGNRSRTILIDEIYQKTLERTQGVSSNGDQDEKASIGKIVTLMSVDCDKIRWFFFGFDRPLIALPISIVISITSLYFVLGWAALTGVVVMLLLLPISSWLSVLLIKFEDQTLKRTDERVAAINEMLQGIRIIKYFSWENHFFKKINETREKELKAFVKMFTIWISLGIIGPSTGIVVAFTTFYVYTVLLGNTLTAATAFTTIKLLNQLKDLMVDLPLEINDALQAKVSIDRISSYLAESNIERYQKKTSQLADSTNKEYLGFENASFRYFGTVGQKDGESATSSEQSFSLRNLNCKFPKGKLSIVCGPTGSGKSSLLMALLGELETLDGSFSFPVHDDAKLDSITGFTNNVAFAAQSPWLLNASIRDNICFGEEFDQERYDEVISGCSLVKDFELFPGGDLTEVGEKGINLSGGQKQRISVARACYSKAAYVILDDPLSAVDAPTARFLLYRCILGLLKGRTLILVTHAVKLVSPFADYVVCLSNGEISCQGSPEELVFNSKSPIFGVPLVRTEFIEDEPETTVKNRKLSVVGLVEEEQQAVGSVGIKIYKKFLSAAGGIKFLIAVLICFGIQTSLRNFLDYWLKVWTEQKQVSFLSNNLMRFRGMQHSLLFLTQDSSIVQMSKNSTTYYLEIYALIGLAVILTGILQELVVRFSALEASRQLHSQMLRSVLFSPLSYFEKTPIGRILNRFSRDISVIDENVAFQLQFFLWTVFSSGFSLVIISSVLPVFLISVPFILVVYVYFAKLFLTCSRELKRIESVVKSPIYSSFSETLAGVCTIRAYGASKRFAEKNRFRVNENNKSYMTLWTTNRWLSLRLGVLSAIVIFCAGTASLLSEISAGWVALILTFALDLTFQFKFAIRMYSNLEMSMNSVERIEEYSELEQEPAGIIESCRPPENWPCHGQIEVKDLSIRYSTSSPLVLDSVNFSIEPGKKLAVVGRTGAGKSTLSLAFFRIIPFANGSISIDGIDISTLGLNDLRTKLTMIPQDPVLFAGTLRSNLDPLGTSDDSSIWEALKRVHFLESLQKNNSLSHEMDGSPAISLDLSVEENGGNFSQGQRQLLCLARSLLQRNQILFLDEATASVDDATDNKIQTTIRNEFNNCTVICIAHRLQTIIDFDKVLVLDKGKVAEFGSPIELIEKKGLFYSMCQQSGKFDDLYSIASKI